MTEPTIGEVADLAKRLGTIRVDGYLITYEGEFDYAPEAKEPRK